MRTVEGIELYTVGEVATKLGVTNATVRWNLSRGIFRGCKLGKQVYITKKSLLAYLESEPLSYSVSTSTLVVSDKHKKMARQVRECLTRGQADAVILRLGLDGQGQRKYKDIARELKVSTQRVYQLYEHGIQNMLRRRNRQRWGLEQMLVDLGYFFVPKEG